MNQQETSQEAQPSKETMLKWMQDQIEFKKIQVELQELDTRIAVSRAEYMKAMYTIAQISNPTEQSGNGLKEHTLTEEDLEANPELEEQGFKTGDVVGIAMEETQEETTTTPSSKRGLKK